MVNIPFFVKIVTCIQLLLHRYTYIVLASLQEYLLRRYQNVGAPIIARRSAPSDPKLIMQIMLPLILDPVGRLEMKEVGVMSPGRRGGRTKEEMEETASEPTGKS